MRSLQCVYNRWMIHPSKITFRCLFIRETEEEEVIEGGLALDKVVYFGHLSTLTAEWQFNLNFLTFYQ